MSAVRRRVQGVAVCERVVDHGDAFRDAERPDHREAEAEIGGGNDGVGEQDGKMPDRARRPAVSRVCRSRHQYSTATRPSAVKALSLASTAAAKASSDAAVHSRRRIPALARARRKASSVASTPSAANSSARPTTPVTASV